jgi:hypothetical protein
MKCGRFPVDILVVTDVLDIVNPYILRLSESYHEISAPMLSHWIQNRLLASQTRALRGRDFPGMGLYIQINHPVLNRSLSFSESASFWGGTPTTNHR